MALPLVPTAGSADQIGANFLGIITIGRDIARGQEGNGNEKGRRPRCVWQRHLSDSLVKQPACKHAHSNRHDSSPLLFGGRGVRPHSSFPHRREGAERRKTLLLSLAPRRRRPRALRARRLPALHLWRLPPWDRLPGPDTGAEPRADPGQLSPPFHPDRVQPSKAALHSKGGREPKATRTPLRVTQGRGRHACSVNQDAPRRRPH